MVRLDAGRPTWQRSTGSSLDHDAVGHVVNPRILEVQLKKLAKLDRAIAVKSIDAEGLEEPAKLRRRRARLTERWPRPSAVLHH